MSELPEKKVLKQTIIKLKSKSITSLESYATYVKIFNENFEGLIGSSNEAIPKLSQEDRAKMETIVLMLGILKNNTMQLVIRSIDTINDLKMYADILESYSTELDSTLSKIFEEAKKMAEEQIKKQEEIIRTKPEYTR